MKLLALAVVVVAVGCGSSLPGGGPGTGGAGGCMMGKLTSPPGTTFPSSDGCNTCTCVGNNQVACTLIACNVPCSFNASYRYGQTGGLVATYDTIELFPPSSYAHTRYPLVTDPPSAACSPALPACDTAGVLDVSDIMHDIADNDVANALAMATPPTFGTDPRPYDGTIFQFLRADGRGFLAGDACAGSAACVEIPGGIVRLVADLRALDTQQLADPSCASLR
jgi:hypothetical protein